MEEFFVGFLIVIVYILALNRSKPSSVIQYLQRPISNRYQSLKEVQEKYTPINSLYQSIVYGQGNHTSSRSKK